MRLSHVAIVLAALVSGAATAAASMGPYWHRSAQMDYQVAADGTSVATEIWEIRADTAAVAHTIAQQSYSYLADLEQVDLVAAFTRKADGRIVKVPPGSVLDKAITTAAAAPQFTAQVARTIVFPQVSAGDTVHYELRRKTTRSMFPGEFLVGLELGAVAVTERADVAISMPPGRTLRTAIAGLEEQAPERRADGSVLRRWRLKAGSDGSVVLQGSTFADYLAVGRAYSTRASRAARPGVGIRALAAKLAPPGTDDRETARRFYRYVSGETRYVAAFLRDGRVVPRDAETVLAEGWGDCKDHSALLQALLAARGIAAEPALITLRSRYDLPDPPGLGVLDHVVTYIPSLDLFLDSTSPYAPFGLLPAGEYDKPVVIADGGKTRLARTPAMPPGGLTLTTSTQARIGASGAVSGRTTTLATGPQSIALRSLAGWLEGRGTSSAASAHLQQAGTPGEGWYSFVSPDFVSSEIAPADYRIDGHFSLDDKLAGDGAVPFAMPRGLSVFGRPGKVLVNAAPTEDGGHACFPGREVETIRLALPPGSQLRTLPDDVVVAAGPARYSSRYQVEDGVVTVRREFRLETDHQRCRTEEFEAMRPALAAAQHDEHALVALTRDEPARVATVPPPAYRALDAQEAPAADGGKRVAGTP